MLFKRSKKSKFWSYDFQSRGQRHQGSTKLSNKEDAARWLRKFRTNLEFEGVGLVAKEPTPTLRDFLDGAFTEHLEQQHHAKPQTLYSYKARMKELKKYGPLMETRLSEIAELDIQGYKNFRLTQKLSIAAINNELRVLRMALLFAARCKLIRYGGVSTLPGEKGRLFVVSGELEKAYLAAAQWPLKQVAILMLDLGVRPEEAVSLRKTNVSPELVEVEGGKTINARRRLPQTARTLEVFQLANELFPESEWVFPGKHGHLTRKHITNLHVELRQKHPEWPKEFVLYSLRHSFATRLAESGAHPSDIQALMGHSSITVSQKYVHLSGDHLGLAMKRAEEYGRMLRGEVHIADSTQEGLKT